jgi:hypothetical protein
VVPSHAETLDLRIQGFDMPGLSCAPPGAGERYDSVHVGLQRGKEVVDLQPGNVEQAEWSFEVTVKHFDGGLDFGGPFVHGRRGDRFVYLSWGVLDTGGFRMFRRAKLHFADAAQEVLEAAVESGRLTCHVRMTDGAGNPRCARVRPPDAMWRSSASE